MRPGFERSSQEVTVANQPLTLTVALEPLEVPGAEPSAGARQGSATDPQALLDRIKTLEQRIADLESGTVLSEPETRVKRIEVYVDKNGNEYDEPVAGRQEGGDLPARARLSPADDSARRSSRRSPTQNDQADRRSASSAASVTQFAQPDQGRPAGRRTATPTSSPRPTCSSRPASRSTRASSPTSSALSGAPPDARDSRR